MTGKVRTEDKIRQKIFSQRPFFEIPIKPIIRPIMAGKIRAEDKIGRRLGAE